MTLLLLVAELIGLYILSQGLTQGLFELTILIFRSRTIGVTIISALTFPGTVIHELAHLFTAEILGVHTGKLTLIPESIDAEEVKTGSVMISETDPFRRYIIGLAPLFVGILAVTAISYFIPTLWAQILTPSSVWYSNPSFYYLLITIYCLLAISNSMFSSKEDLKGFIPFLISLLVIIAIGYFAGLRIGLTGGLLDFASKILDALVKSLGVVLAINIGGFVLIKGITSLTQKLTRRRIIRG